MAELIKLRAEKAAILDFENHAAFVLDMRMAKSPRNVEQFLKDLSGVLFTVIFKLFDKMSLRCMVSEIWYGGTVNEFCFSVLISNCFDGRNFLRSAIFKFYWRQ